MKVVRQTADIYESAMDEYARSMVEKQRAEIDYLSMMTGIEIPTEEVENVSEVH